MGTRNLTMVVKNKKIKVAQYCQWDGYPKGQGKEIVDFLLNPINRINLSEEIDSVRFLDKEKVEEFYNKKEIQTMDDKKFTKKYPQFSRNTGAEILSHIATSSIKELVDSSDFVNDSLFNEWTYVIDLDKEVLEVYSGYVKSKPKRNAGRFIKKDTQPKDGYYPVKLLKKFKFNELCIKKMQELDKND